jgi:alkylated DNA repair dioxygenase AlkB
MQSPLFTPPESSDPICLLERDGRAEYSSHFFSADESNHFFERLQHSLSWKADQINMFGKLVTTARKVAWVGDPQCRYTYSGIEKIPQDWTEELLQIKHQLEEEIGYSYNSCLLNLYHNGDEGMGWHSDNEKELDSATPIA